jgi:hypothetical protein
MIPSLVIGGGYSDGLNISLRGCIKSTASRSYSDNDISIYIVANKNIIVKIKLTKLVNFILTIDSIYHNALGKSSPVQYQQHYTCPALTFC